jgi:hypothetical protein
MERFRLNIDIKNAEDASQAVGLFLRTLAQNPNQEVGNGGIVTVELDNKSFDVVRNINSYTIREVEVVREVGVV